MLSVMIFEGEKRKDCLILVFNALIKMWSENEEQARFIFVVLVGRPFHDPVITKLCLKLMYLIGLYLRRCMCIETFNFSKSLIRSYNLKFTK